MLETALLMVLVWAIVCVQSVCGVGLVR